MSRDGRGPAHERPSRVQPTGRAGVRHRFAASPVRPHVYYRPTPHGKWVTIVNVDALTADERADIAEAADRTEATGGSAEGDRLRVQVSPALEADAVYVEDARTPMLLLRPGRSHEHAVVTVAYCVPGMSPLEARRLVDAHLPGDGAMFPMASKPPESTSRARTGPGRARLLVLSALAGVAALVVSVMAVGSDGPAVPGKSADVDRSSWGAMPARSAERTAVHTSASPSAQAIDRASESVSAEITPVHDPLVEDTSDDESAPAPSSEEDEPADMSAESSTDPTTSPVATESSDPGQGEDESDGLLGAIISIFD